MAIPSLGPTFSRCRKSHVNSPCALMVEDYSWKTKNYEYEFVSLHSCHSEAPFKSLTFVNGPGKTIIRQSCGGLLLCTSYDESRKVFVDYVCNPTTKQWTQLSPSESRKSVVCGVSLAFDPSKSPYYIVVCVRAHDLSEQDEDDVEVVYEIDVYSSKERRWMISTTGSFTTSGDITFRDGVFWNGAIHWLGRLSNSLYFNVDKDQLGEMPALSIPEARKERRLARLEESRGRLHLVQNVEPPSIRFNVYEMSEDYSGWNVKYRVDLGAVVTAFPDVDMSYDKSGSLTRSTVRIVCVSRGETDEDSFLLLQIPSNIIRVSLNDGTSFQKLCDFRLGVANPHTYKYYKTLASL